MGQERRFFVIELSKGHVHVGLNILKERLGRKIVEFVAGKLYCCRSGIEVRTWDSEPCHARDQAL